MGKPAVIVSVEKQPNVDTVRLTREIEQALTELTATLPHGIKADQILFRQANFIETSIDNVEQRAARGRRRRRRRAVRLPAELAHHGDLADRDPGLDPGHRHRSSTSLGLSINTMTLGGLAIAIGELVDDAVVDVENIFRRLRENRALGNPRSAFDVVVSASQEVRSGIVYATLIIVLVFVPLFALSGIEGRLFAPLGQAYIISILASLVVSITLTPVMAYYMLPQPEAPGRARQRAGARAQARQPRRCSNAPFAISALLMSARAARGRRWRRSPRRCCRAPSCRRSTRAPSPSTCCSIRASRSPNPTASA